MRVDLVGLTPKSIVLHRLDRSVEVLYMMWTKWQSVHVAEVGVM